MKVRKNLMIDREKVRSKIKDKLRTLDIDFDALHFDLDEIADRIIDNERTLFGIDSSLKSDRQEEVIDIMKKVLRGRDGSFWSGESTTYYHLWFDLESENVYEISLHHVAELDGHDLYVDLGDGIIDVAREAENYSVPQLVDELASRLNCSVVEVPETVERLGLAYFDRVDYENVEVSDESETYEWFENNVDKKSIFNLISNAIYNVYIFKKVSCRLFEEIVDFSDCYEE